MCDFMALRAGDVLFRDDICRVRIEEEGLCPTGDETLSSTFSVWRAYESREKVIAYPVLHRTRIEVARLAKASTRAATGVGIDHDTYH